MRRSSSLDRKAFGLSQQQQQQPSRQVCKFFQSRKGCWKGNQCPFLHVKEGQQLAQGQQAINMEMNRRKEESYRKAAMQQAASAYPRSPGLKRSGAPLHNPRQGGGGQGSSSLSLGMNYSTPNSPTIRGLSSPAIRGFNPGQINRSSTQGNLLTRAPSIPTELALPAAQNTAWWSHLSGPRQLANKGVWATNNFNTHASSFGSHKSSFAQAAAEARAREEQAIRDQHMSWARQQAEAKLQDELRMRGYQAAQAAELQEILRQQYFAQVQAQHQEHMRKVSQQLAQALYDLMPWLTSQFLDLFIGAYENLCVHSGHVQLTVKGFAERMIELNQVQLMYELGAYIQKGFHDPFTFDDLVHTVLTVTANKTMAVPSTAMKLCDVTHQLHSILNHTVLEILRPLIGQPHLTMEVGTSQESFPKLIRALKSWISPRSMDNMARLFRLLDRDKSGTLSLSEIFGQRGDASQSRAWVEMLTYLGTRATNGLITEFDFMDGLLCLVLHRVVMMRTSQQALHGIVSHLRDLVNKVITEELAELWKERLSIPELDFMSFDHFNVISEMFPGQMKFLCDQAFRTLDVTCDGFITIEDFLPPGVPVNQLDIHTMALWKKLIQFFDIRTRDECIGSEEFRDALIYMVLKKPVTAPLQGACKLSQVCEWVRALTMTDIKDTLSGLMSECGRTVDLSNMPGVDAAQEERSVIDAVKGWLTRESLDLMRETFVLLDVNGDGILSAKDFVDNSIRDTTALRQQMAFWNEIVTYLQKDVSAKITWDYFLDRMVCLMLESCQWSIAPGQQQMLNAYMDQAQTMVNTMIQAEMSKVTDSFHKNTHETKELDEGEINLLVALLSEDMQQQLKTAFLSLDVDGDGSITVKDFISRGESFTINDVPRMTLWTKLLTHFDRHRRDQIITKEEFTEGMVVAAARHLFPTQRAQQPVWTLCGQIGEQINSSMNNELSGLFQEISNSLNAMNQSKRRRVDENEAQRALANSVMAYWVRDDVHELLRQAYVKLDTNGDGVLTVEDVTEKDVNATSVDLTKLAVWVKMVERLDCLEPDDKITFEEFGTGLAHIALQGTHIPSRESMPVGQIVAEIREVVAKRITQEVQGILAEIGK